MKFRVIMIAAGIAGSIWLPLSPACTNQAKSEQSPLYSAPVAPGNSIAAAPAQASQLAQDASTRDLDAVTKISAAAIAAAKDDIDQTRWVFTAGSIVVSVLVTGFAFLGYQNIRGIAERVRREARRRIDVELGVFRETIRAATDLAVRAQAAMRQVNLAEKWTEAEDNKRSCFRRAIAAIHEARKAAAVLQDDLTERWTHSFEAYCLSSLGRHSEAVSEQVIALQTNADPDPLDLYNLACYYANDQKYDQAKKVLERVIVSTGDNYRCHAAADPDFAEMRKAGMLDDLLKGVSSAEPLEKSPPALPRA
jgi:tetratricopeptide (TPR) repeat protein